MWSYTQIVAAPGYGTDEVAFDQYAAQLLLHGINPYVHSMARAFSLFHVSPNGYTFRLTGQPVTSLSYPALSFLVYVPVPCPRLVDPAGGLDQRRRLGDRDCA